jgi:mono/diheme cytochrome c family protein
MVIVRYVLLLAVVGGAVGRHDVVYGAEVGPRGDAQRGQALFAAAGGCGCHTPAAGPVGAGGREVVTPFGTFYGTNVTPDRETGIGGWSDAEIDDAIRRGVVRGRGAESPVMPYYRYAGLADRDVADLIAYLRALPPVRRANREHDVAVPLARLGFWAWRLLYGRGVPGRTDALPGEVERGRYLVDHVSICGDCHTPRNVFGAPIAGMYLAGAADGPNGEPVPNVTPDLATGIGDWTAEDIVTLLESGVKPSFDNVQGLMADMIDGHGGGPGYADMPPGDRDAIAAYLRTIPPVANDIGAE